MPSLISLPPNAAVHQDDAASGIKAPKLPSRTAPAPTTEAKAAPSKPPEFTIKANSVALSFAYDTLTKALNVVMTDKHSGEVVRKISYTHLPTSVHQADKLHGLLLDQLA